MSERWFLDACDPAGFVAGFDAYLTYCDGRCTNVGGGPFGALAVISSRAQCGRIGDCEPQNPRPAVWAAIEMPVVYCAWDGLSSFFDGYKESDVLTAYDAAGVPRPHLWVARPGWNALSFWRPEIIAVQTGLVGAYDISLTDDAGLAIILGGDAMTPDQAAQLAAIYQQVTQSAAAGTIPTRGQQLEMLFGLLTDGGNPAKLSASFIDALAVAVVAKLPAGGSTLTADQVAAAVTARLHGQLS